MNDDHLVEDLQYIQYTLTLSLKLKERLEKHLQRLKYLQHPQSRKQFWLLQALQEKLLGEEKNSDSHKVKHLHVTLTQEIVENLNARLALSPKTFTKKKWVLEAIEEKLEAEKTLIQTKQDQFKKNKSSIKKNLAVSG